MKRLLQLVLLLCGLGIASSAHASISVTGSCSAATTNCTLSGTATGDLIVVFHHRASTTAPGTDGNTAVQNFATSSGGTVGSIRVTCRKASSGSDTASGTSSSSDFTAAISFAGTNVGTTANCGTTGIGGTGCGTTSNCWAKTSTTVTYRTLTMSNGDGSSWIVGFMNGSASSVCDATVLTARSSAGSGRALDSHGGVSSYAGETCTVSSETWMSWTGEILQALCSNTTYGSFSCIQSAISGRASSATSATATMPANTTAHNAVMVAVVWQLGTDTATNTFSDGNSDTVTQPSTQCADFAQTGTRDHVCAAVFCDVGATTTFTATLSTTVNWPVMSAVEVSGADTSSCIDGDNSMAISTTSDTSLSLSQTTSAEAFLHGHIDNSSDIAVTPTGGAFELGVQSTTGHEHAGLYASGSGSNPCSWSFTAGGSAWGSCLALAVAGGGGGAPPLSFLPLLGVGAVLFGIGLGWASGLQLREAYAQLFPIPLFISRNRFRSLVRRIRHAEDSERADEHPEA